MIIFKRQVRYVWYRIDRSSGIGRDIRISVHSSFDEAWDRLKDMSNSGYECFLAMEVAEIKNKRLHAVNT